jgi:hypothetical protein
MANRSGIRLFIWGVLLLGVCAPVSAQMLTGPWVVESEKQIDKVRKIDLRVIVMDASGRPARGVAVRIEQTRSAFHVGLILPETGWPVQGLGAGTYTEFWRCINAVSLEQLTDWPTLQPTHNSILDATRIGLIETVLHEARQRGLFVRWGPMISADAGRLPGWAAELSGQALADAVDGYSGLVWQRFGGQIDQYDVYTQMLDHGFIENQAGAAAVRRLYESVPAKSSGAQACARFSDVLSVGRFQPMQRRLTALSEAFIPVQVVAIDQRFGGALERRTLARTVARIDQIQGPVVISGLTVGGDSEVNAAINLETALRTLMERPSIEGIWFAGLTPDMAIEPSSALLNDMGLPTPSGRLIDSLFTNLWRTDIDTQADGLGNVRARVFPGAYRITAKLPDGSESVTSIWVQKTGDTRVVLLEPLRPGVVIGGAGD